MTIEQLAKKVKEKKIIECYKINTEKKENLSIFESKFGGVPYWDFKEDYPKNDKGENLFLLAQINFEEESFNDERLPEKGLLQFFISCDDLYGMDFDKLDSQKNFRVVYHENINKDINENDIKEKGVKPLSEIDDKYMAPFTDSYKITFKKDESGINAMNLDFTEEVSKVLKETFNEDIPKDKVYDYLNDLNEDWYEFFPGFGYLLFGYPSFTQYDPRETNKDYERYDTLLFQIDSEGDILWGDSGVANFFINEKDLLNKDFSKVLYNWDCY